MDPTLILGYSLALLTGLLLGMMGGGGSTLTVPVLVYLMGIEPVLATSYSLFIVGISSLIGSLEYMRYGMLSYRTALIFAIPSILTVFGTRHFILPALPNILFSLHGYDLTRDLAFGIFLVFGVLGTAFFLLHKRIAHHQIQLNSILSLMVPAATMVFVVRQFLIPLIPNHLIEIGNWNLSKNQALLIIFAIVMFGAGIAMIHKSNDHIANNKPTSHNIRLVIQGLVVGSLTGLIGAGGGFLIIPTLVIMTGLPMSKAVGTSLLIITINSLIGFMGDIDNPKIHWSILLIFASISLIGVFVGTHYSRKIPAQKLKTAFGYFTLLMGLAIGLKETCF